MINFFFMPQMSPMNWMILMIMFLFMLMLTNILMYFSKTKNNYNTYNYKIKSLKKSW